MRANRRMPSAALRRPAACLGVAAVLALSGCNPGTGARAEPPPPTVGVAEAHRQDVPLTANPNGTTRALKQVAVQARVRGFLEKIEFQEGADVEPGQLLFVIEEKPFQVALESAQAKKAEADASLERAQVSKAREIAIAQVAVSQAMLALARVEETRQRTLLNRSAASPQDVDRAEAERRRRDAEVEAAKANYDQAKADYDVNILAAKAEIAAAEAAVRDAEINLGYCRMYAPIEGRIGEAKIKVGNLVGPLSGGSDPTELATIQQLDPMGVDIQVSSRYLARATELIQHGLTMRLTRPGLEGEAVHPHEGKVFFIDNAIDPTTSTFLTKAEIPNPQKTLLPGEYVKLDLVVGDVPDALVVPEQAVIETQGGEMVYVVDDQGTVGIARVKATYTHQGLRVIESGLEEGAKVVVEGIQLVRPGMKVKVGEVSGKGESEPTREEVSRKDAKGAEKEGKGEAKNARE